MKESLKKRLRCAWSLVRIWYMKHFVHAPYSDMLQCFFIPFFLTFLSYTMIGTFPFGPNSVLVLDLNAQYVYFFDALRDAVYGDGSLLYSFSRAMGGEFTGMYAYYLASPLSYIVCLFPRGAITEALYLILAIKTGLLGLTFGWFLKKTQKTKPLHTVILAVIYAFSGYATAYQSHTMWIDALYLLPLIAVGMHALIYERRAVLFTLSLAATMIFNYYIGYMTCIFVLFYFFALYFSKSRAERNPSGERAHLLRSLIRIGVASLVGIAIAAFMIIPAYYSLTFGKDTFTTPSYDFMSLYPMLDIFGKLLVASYDTLSPAGLPFLYSGTIALFLLPLFFLSKRIAIREKVAYATMLLLFLFFATIRATDLVFHGFQAPNWMNCRYSFVFTFLILTAAARFLTVAKKSEVRSKTVIGIGATIVAFTAVYFILSEEKLRILASLILTLGFVSFYVYAYVYPRIRPHMKQVLAIVTVAVIGFEVLVQAVATLIGLELDVVISNRSSYVNFGNRFYDVAERIERDETLPFYRVEKTVTRKLNDNFQLGIYGLSNSTSTLNRAQIDFLATVGMTARSNFSQYCFPNPVSDMLLGVRYVMTAPSMAISADYTLRYVKCGGEIHDAKDVSVIRKDDGVYCALDGIEIRLNDATDVLVYEYEKALSLGFSASEKSDLLTFTQPAIDNTGEYILEDGVKYYSVHTGDTKNACERLNLMLSALTGEDVRVYTELSHTVNSEHVTPVTTYRQYTVTSENGEETRNERFYSFHYRRDDDIPDGEKATVSLTFTGVDGKDVYMYIPAASFDQCTYYVNEEKRGDYFGLYNYGAVYLGSFNTGDEVTVTFEVGKDGVHMGKDVPYFYTLDKNALDRAYALLSDNQMEIERFGHDDMTATVTGTADDSVLVTTIPYDAGWQVTVDGIPVETRKTLDALLAFDIGEGTHTVTFTYFPDCYRTGIIISVCGIVAFIPLILLPELWHRKRRRAAISQSKSEV